MYFAPNGQSDSDIYYKGAWVLHTLRWLVNDDEAFLRALRRMAYPTEAMESVTDGSQCRFVDTEDFLRIAERETGMELAAFFEVYLRSAGLPRLQTQRVTRSGEDGLALSWVLPDGALPEGMTFEVPVQIVVNGEARRVAMRGGEGFIALPADAEPVIDPDTWLLMGETVTG
jgi:aminopeptidase N